MFYYSVTTQFQTTRQLLLLLIYGMYKIYEKF